MKKRLFRTFSALLVCAVLVGGMETGQIYAGSSTPPAPPIMSPTSVVEPQADIIDWRYKVIGGKLYKRLYNYSTDTWIGDWILVE